MSARKAAAAVLLAVAFLSGCNESNPSNPGGPRGTFRTAVVDVDGREIPCITWKSGHGGGLSCDWGPR